LYHCCFFVPFELPSENRTTPEKAVNPEKNGTTYSSQNPKPKPEYAPTKTPAPLRRLSLYHAYLIPFVFSK